MEEVNPSRAQRRTSTEGSTTLSFQRKERRDSSLSEHHQHSSFSMRLNKPKLNNYNVANKVFNRQTNYTVLAHNEQCILLF